LRLPGSEGAVETKGVVVHRVTPEEAAEKGAAAGMGVVRDPRTSDILALAIRPTFNPNTFADVPSRDAWRNRAVTDPFERGSTFEVSLAAAALEEGVVRPDDRIYAENGQLTIAKTVIHDWKKFGWLTFSEVLQNSSNVGSMRAYEKRRDTLGFATSTDVREEEQIERRLREELKRTFRPEFLHRIDEGIIFPRLAETSLYLVVDKMLGELRTRLAERGLTLELTDAARAWLVHNGYDPAYGAPPLRRLIQKEVENALARRVLGSEFASGDCIRVNVVDDRLDFGLLPQADVATVTKEVRQSVA